MRRLHVAIPWLFASTCPNRRNVHDRPFREKAHDEQLDDAVDVAKEALLQFNLMVDRGIVPDALTYTSLIATMGRARWEWQAYKLFARMLQQEIVPLPETYVALRDATSPKRRKLIDDLSRKIEESMHQLPSRIAVEARKQRLEMDRLCVERFEAYMNREVTHALPASLLADTSPVEAPATTPTAAPTPPPFAEGGADDSGRETKKQESSDLPRGATVHIRHPEAAWSAHKALEDLHGPGLFASKPCAAATDESEASSREEIERELGKLHDEELRIYLTVKRQLRHGTKAELVARVLDTISANDIRGMLARRRRYFRAVEGVLRIDVESLQHQPNQQHGSDDAADAAEVPLTGDASHSAAQMAKMEEPAASVGSDQAYRDSSSTLITPWGVIHKPLRHTVKSSSASSVSSNARWLRQDDNELLPTERSLIRVALNAEEMDLLVRKMIIDEGDELPPSLLRRYAHQHRLRWKRQEPGSLLDIVSWHAKKFYGGKVVAPTPALRAQAEARDLEKTLEAVDAFRIISQRTKNLQVVDDKELNLHLVKTRAAAITREKYDQTAARRERHLREAEALQQQARTFTGASLDDSSEGEEHQVAKNNRALESDDKTRILGWTSTPTATPKSDESDRGIPPAPTTQRNELPPWAVESDSGATYNFKTKRFGDPLQGRYREMDDGRFKVVPNREAQTTHDVDVKTLPAPLRDAIESAQRNEALKSATETAAREEKLKFASFRKFDRFVARAKEKKRQEREERLGANGATPVGPKRRMSYHLIAGRDGRRLQRDEVNQHHRPL